jgi:hypothetical protein
VVLQFLSYRAKLKRDSRRCKVEPPPAEAWWCPEACLKSV